jgi:hypothetical protein
MQAVVRAGAFAAVMVFDTLFGSGASGARAQDSVTVAAATPVPQSGSAWIAQGTASTTPPEAAAALIPSVPAEPQARADSLLQLVGDMPIDEELAPELKCLAQAVYFEARGEPLDGQLAVAEVVINRAVSGLYPADYCEVVTQPAQFSFVRHGRIPQADEGSAAWRRAIAVAQIAQQDLWESKANDALYFHATYVHPTWSRQKIQLAQIDTHIFYR